MIRTLDGRSLLFATLCICFAQTFVDGSSNAMGFAPAFAAALDAYVGSRTEEAVVDEIREITDSTHPPQPASPPLPERTNTSTSRWFPQPAWLKKRKYQKRKEREEKERQVREEREERKRERKEREDREEKESRALVDIIKTHRLRFHEERKAQMEAANLL
ncbi:hypothetical protein C8R45DRAFT_1036730 [Mycena sanguinolenta]|nr:hypothetical protein C8R45DRAFT_1036730 [Mycena sanguinolenta]